MIYLLRHGLDDESRIGGYSNVHLSESGMKQVKDARKFICDNLQFNKIVSSDITRAKETTQIINEVFNKPVIYTKLLREQDKGIYNGVRKSCIGDNDEFLNNVSIYDKYPEGESLLDLYFRVESLLLIIDKWDGDLLVTHRGVINMIYYLLNNKKPDMYKDSFGVQHASIHKLNLRLNKIERIY